MNGIELNNENKDRLRLLCKDILNQDMSRDFLMNYANSYLIILKQEEHEQKRNTQNKVASIS